MSLAQLTEHRIIFVVGRDSNPDTRMKILTIRLLDENNNKKSRNLKFYRYNEAIASVSALL
jgi:hypothetical protein